MNADSQDPGRGGVDPEVLKREVGERPQERAPSPASDGAPGDQPGEDWFEGSSNRNEEERREPQRPRPAPRVNIASILLEQAPGVFHWFQLWIAEQGEREGFDSLPLSDQILKYLNRISYEHAEKHPGQYNEIALLLEALRGALGNDQADAFIQALLVRRDANWTEKQKSIIQSLAGPGGE